MIVIPILLIFAAAIGVIHVMLYNAAVSNIRSAQGSMMALLEQEVKDASLQLSHFVYVNDGEFMELASQADTPLVAQKNEYTDRLDEAFELAMTPKQDIVSMQFYMKDGMSIYLKDELVLSKEEMKESGWYQQALEHKNEVSVGSYDTGSMSISRSRLRKWELIIVAAFAPDISADRSGKIENIALFYRSNLGNLVYDYEKDAAIGMTALLDENGDLIYGGRSGEEEMWYLDQLKDRETGVHSQRVTTYGDAHSREAYTYVITGLPYMGWRIVNMVPSRLLTQRLQRIVSILIAVILALFVLFYLFSRYFLRNILNPIHNVVEGMADVQAGDLDTHLEPAGQAEIRRMIHSFNRMVRTLKSSIAEKELAQDKKHEAEIRALQSQINPHFLVNTLNSIRFMAQVSKFEGIRKMAEALMKIVSCSFRSNIGFYTLQEEMEVLDSYIYLMKIRYSEGFEAEYQVEEEALSCLVPRLILQPVVENSIVHGFTGENIGHLCIAAKVHDGMLCMSVRDDGCGMSREQIEQISRGKPRDEDDNTSIGMENVIARLKLNFGERCSIRIDSELGAYTETVLQIPMREKQEEPDE